MCIRELFLIYHRKVDSIEEIIRIYKKDIDVTLIDERLRLTPEERVRRAEDFGFFLEQLRAAKGNAG
jgi:hypothetical protein